LQNFGNPFLSNLSNRIKVGENAETGPNEAEILDEINSLSDSDFGSGNSVNSGPNFGKLHGQLGPVVKNRNFLNNHEVLIFRSDFQPWIANVNISSDEPTGKSDHEISEIMNNHDSSRENTPRETGTPQMIGYQTPIYTPNGYPVSFFLRFFVGISRDYFYCELFITKFLLKF